MSDKIETNENFLANNIVVYFPMNKIETLLSAETSLADLVKKHLDDRDILLERIERQLDLKLSREIQTQMDLVVCTEVTLLIEKDPTCQTLLLSDKSIIVSLALLKGVNFRCGFGYVLNRAIKARNISVVKVLLNDKRVLDVKTDIDLCDSITIAAHKGLLDIVKLLCDDSRFGSDLCYKAMEDAIRIGHYDIVYFLLNHEKIVKVETEYHSFLDIACKYNHFAIIDLLLADVRVKLGRTFSAMVFDGNVETIKYLLSKDSLGITAEYLADLNREYIRKDMKEETYAILDTAITNLTSAQIHKSSEIHIIQCN